MRRCLIQAYIGSLGAMLCWAQPSWGGVIVRFEPDQAVLSLGDTSEVQIVADISEPVVGWGLDLTFDGMIVSQVGSPMIGSAWLEVLAADGDGLAAIAFPPSISGTGILLATVLFSGDMTGETDLIASITIGDLAEGFPLDPSGFAAITFENGHVTVIPEPGTLVLAALGGLAVMRRTRRTA